MARRKDLWKEDGIQFPRLLAEIRACSLTRKQYEFLSAEMDLTRDEIDEILERAEERWTGIKQRTLPPSRRLSAAGN